MTTLKADSPTRSVAIAWQLVNGALVICSIAIGFQLWLVLLGDRWPRYSEAPLICYATGAGIWVVGCAAFWMRRIRVSVILSCVFLVGFFCGIPLMPLYQSRLERVMRDIRNGHIALYGPTVPILCGGFTVSVISALWMRLPSKR